MWKRKNILLGLGVALFAVLGHLLFWWPSRAVFSWKPAPSSAALKTVKRTPRVYAASVALEPEDVLPLPGGSFLLSCKDGTLREVIPRGMLSILARTGGRPLGLARGPRHTVLVADAVKGLLQVESRGSWKVLVQRYKGKALGYVDDVVMSKDQRTVYFTNATERINWHEDTRPDLLSLEPTGSLFRYDLQTKKLTRLMTGLTFANGVTLSPRERFVLVNETGRYQIRRHWLRGPNKGRSDVFASNLPGYPDNIRPRRGGGYWVALVSSRLRSIDQWVHPTLWLKKLVLTTPLFLWPPPQPVGRFLALSKEGVVKNVWELPRSSSFANITTVREYKGALLLGRIYRDQRGFGVLQRNSLRAPKKGLPRSP